MTISPVLLRLGPTFKCLYLCFRCLGTFWQCQNLRQEAAILDFKMAAKCVTLLCISLIIALWKENKDCLHLGKYLLSGNCHHMAAISEFKMTTTLLDMQFSMIYRCRLPCQLSLRKLLYRHFAQMAAIFNFPMTAALQVLFRVIEHTNMHIHVSYFQSPTYNKSQHICKVGCIPGQPCNNCNSPCTA